ncbi:MAG: tagaturonate reductase [Erysipelotrichaceae bacterium]|nr:tagaturonate reductase [Erysipelotrichaceae bacterium]
MEQLNAKMTNPKKRPVVVMQYGEGNFLRAFVEYMIDLANEKGLMDAGVVLVKPIPFGSLERFDQQDNQYTLQLRGRVNKEEYVETRQITCVTDTTCPFDDYDKYISYAKCDTLRFIVSNTTEAGIVYHDTDKFEEKLDVTYPAKLTQFLYERYKAFDGAYDKGLVMLPVELIDDNGIELKKCVKNYIKLWDMEAGFEKWIDEACVFTSTLVDRIVTGYPRNEAEKIWEELGYKDELLDTAEPFALWVIESEKDISKELPLDKALEGKEGMNVIFTDNQKPYKQRKVRILNGAHTSFVLASYLKGNDYVNQSMNDDIVRDFMMKTIHEEVIPTLTLPKADLEEFADAVVDRFNNPFIQHALLAISLNSVSKWKARCMPSFLGYVEKFNKLPEHLTFSLAALMAFYSGKTMADGVMYAVRDGQEYEVKDDVAVLEFFLAESKKPVAEFVHNTLTNTSFWGQDLTAVAGAEAKIVEYLDTIQKEGMGKALEKYFA